MNLRGLKLGFDLDDTIIDHTRNRIVLAWEYGYTLTENDLRNPPRAPLSDTELKTFLDTLYGPLSMSAPPIAGSVDVLRALADEGTSLYIISRRHPEGRPDACRWIARHLPFIPKNHILFVDEAGSKGGAVIHLGLYAYKIGRASCRERV